jgi:hypothetical protein
MATAAGAATSGADDRLLYLDLQVPRCTTSEQKLTRTQKMRKKTFQ